MNDKMYTFGLCVINYKSSYKLVDFSDWKEISKKIYRNFKNTKSYCDYWPPTIEYQTIDRDGLSPALKHVTDVHYGDKNRPIYGHFFEIYPLRCVRKTEYTYLPPVLLFSSSFFFFLILNASKHYKKRVTHFFKTLLTKK